MEDKVLSKKKKLLYTNNNLFYTNTDDKFILKIDAIQPDVKQSSLILRLSFFNSNLIWIEFRLKFGFEPDLMFL